ncbi:MAG: DUF885 family protein [Candidatus Aminicenantaceae bacterium]
MTYIRQQAIDFIMKNTLETLDNVTAEVDRYAVMTAQATAYMIGKLKIEEIRAAAETKPYCLSWRSGAGK